MALKIHELIWGPVGGPAVNHMTTYLKNIHLHSHSSMVYWECPGNPVMYVSEATGDWTSEL